MLAQFKSVIGFSVLVLACACLGIAQEPEHFYQFFEKGQVVHISDSSAESQFLSAVILTPDDWQRVTDSRSLSADDMVKKYPDLGAKVDEALKKWPEKRKQQGRPEDTKAKVFIYSTLRTSGTSYRVIAAKSDYLLVESLSSPSYRVVYALDKIKTIYWFRGLGVQAVAEDVKITP